jgi:hypothetical protein
MTLDFLCNGRYLYLNFDVTSCDFHHYVTSVRAANSSHWLPPVAELLSLPSQTSHDDGSHIFEESYLIYRSKEPLFDTDTVLFSYKR